MKIRWLVRVFAALAISVILRAAQDPLIGTWELNRAKSKGTPPPNLRETLKYEPYGDGGVKSTSEGVNALGNPIHTEYTGYYDGKEYPVTGNRDADTIVMKRIDAYTTERIFKKEGKVTRVARRTVSKDGKILTMTNRGRNAQGQNVDTVVVFDRK